MKAQLIPVDRANRPALTQEPPATGPGRQIAILCGGPSLRDHWSDGRAAEFDEVVAVNGACFVFACDYAVMVDRPIVAKLIDSPAHHPRKALVTYAAAYKSRFVDKKQARHVRMLPIPTLGPAMKSFTFPRAIKFALSLCGNGEIHVFGCDMSDVGRDVAGIRGDHGIARWERECTVLRAIWDRRIVAVHGKARADWLAYVRGELPRFPA
jgi:hypothetical protein